MTATQPARTDPERHKEQVRAANRARHRAVKRLIAMHPGEFDILYADEAKKEGVEPKPRTKSEVAQMQSQIERLTAALDSLTSGAKKKVTRRG